MRSYTSLLLICLFLSGSSCSKSTAPASGTAALPSPQASLAAAVTVKGLDACALLTSKELQAVQGEAIKETEPSTRTDGGFVISQCFYRLPTFANSISLLVAQKGDSVGARDPKEFWQETFHRSENEEGSQQDTDKGRNNVVGRDGSTDQAQEREEEKAAPPQKISGLGDDAYWTGNRVGGALYALKGNTYIRVSVGGPGDQAVKIRKAKALAQIALKRL